tara:strand:+ start:725 stop:1234 length:510 start_codon:yes stop_codon:yes gene_type:complete
MINLNLLTQYLSRPKVLVFLFLMFFLNLAWFQTLPFDARFYMLDTYFAFNYEDISRIIDAIGNSGRSAYITAMYTIDLVFPIIYTCLSLGLMRKLHTYELLYLLPISAFTADIFQNIQTAIIMTHSSVSDISSGQIVLASFTNQLKWLLIFLMISIIIILTLKKLTFRR